MKVQPGDIAPVDVWLVADVPMDPSWVGYAWGA